jgi:YVTN family beta-propeller protein
MSDLRFRLLGPLEAERGGIRLELGPRKQRAVLALLLLEANRIVPTDRLIDELWGDAPPETARSALQVYVAGLRKALGEDGASLRTQAPGYVLDLEPGTLDLQAFTALRAEARDASDPGRAADALHEALALWRGTPLAELDGAPFGAATRAQLEEQRLGALEDRIDADLALGRHAELIHELDAIVAEHPYRERFRAQQMLALYRSGRQADALAAYRSAREAFVEGLGIEPGAELKALERQVLDQDPGLAAPAPPPTAVEAEHRGPRIAIAAAALAALVGVAVTAAVLLRDEPAGITVEPNSVAIIDPKTNDVVDAVSAGTEPGPITSGGGAVWVGNAGNVVGKSVTRINPRSRKVVETIPLDATPTGVAFGHGSLWVAHGLTGQVARIDPEFYGKETIDDVAKTKFASPGAIDAGNDAVWAVFGDATLARIDPGSSAVDQTDAGHRPTGVVEGGDWLWAVSSANSTVYRFSPRTFQAGPIGRTSVGRRSTGITYGHDAVWVTSSGDDFVTRIDPSTYAGRQIDVGEEPQGIAVGAGAVWVANAGDGTVSRIDPATRKVVKTIQVGNSPVGIAVAAGLVWVTVQAP